MDRKRLGSRAHAFAALAIGIVVVVGGLAPAATKAAEPDPSDVVLVLDFSASILQDKTNRNRFGAALERIAARVDETVGGSRRRRRHRDDRPVRARRRPTPRAAST